MTLPHTANGSAPILMYRDWIQINGCNFILEFFAQILWEYDTNIMNVPMELPHILKNGKLG